MTLVEWKPYTRSERDRIRITETSCCAAYEWACQGGHFLILRRSGKRYEEAARGLYRQARDTWESLILEHARDHMERQKGKGNSNGQTGRVPKNRKRSVRADRDRGIPDRR
ncbi:hypothetical protein GCM10010156_61100 [Planobispora rosea]|uniref:Uncharacterized protein n=1 Tax=Planobispora rosea TaxID=35762 RepID=A0A8J3S7I5_PLARO|nr:hypothetical protein GCM10010156_61100 [Planobispora rosea]GIH87411.1 hypothetical protein Pro02_58190 [Planobispora rosea]